MNFYHFNLQYGTINKFEYVAYVAAQNFLNVKKTSKNGWKMLIGMCNSIVLIDKSLFWWFWVKLL